MNIFSCLFPRSFTALHGEGATPEEARLEKWKNKIFYHAKNDEDLFKIFTTAYEEYKNEHRLTNVDLLKIIFWIISRKSAEEQEKTRDFSEYFPEQDRNLKNPQCLQKEILQDSNQKIDIISNEEKQSLELRKSNGRVENLLMDICQEFQIDHDTDTLILVLLEIFKQLDISKGFLAFSLDAAQCFDLNQRQTLQEGIKNLENENKAFSQNFSW